MRIAELIKESGQFISLEFFPPREKSNWPGFLASVEKLRALKPLFASVTYGAMGGTRDHTLEMVTILKREFGLETMAHLTCVGASEESIDSFLDRLVSSGVDNVLALRGDFPPGGLPPDIGEMNFRCAAELVSHIRARYPSLGIGVAAYPEGHPEAENRDEDLAFLKDKLDQGADFAITQLFFDNDLYWDFADRARAMGIEKPIIPGLLPITNLGNLQKIISLSSATVQEPLLDSLREAMENGGGESVKEIGVRHAVEQGKGLLAGGAPGLHLYTLNKADACLDIARRLGLG